jgi:hypothetical protein
MDETLTCDVLQGFEDMPLAPPCFWCGTPMSVIRWTDATGEWHVAQVMCQECRAAGPLPDKASGHELMAHAMAVGAFHKPRSKALADALRDGVVEAHGITIQPASTDTARNPPRTSPG